MKIRIHCQLITYMFADQFCKVISIKRPQFHMNKTDCVITIYHDFKFKKQNSKITPRITKFAEKPLR